MPERHHLRPEGGDIAVEMDEEDGDSRPLGLQLLNLLGLDLGQVVDSTGDLLVDLLEVLLEHVFAGFCLHLLILER